MTVDNTMGDYLNFQVVNYVVNIILFLIFTCLAYVGTSDNDKKFLGFLRKKPIRTAAFCEIISTVYTVIDAVGIANTGGLHLLSMWTTIFGAIVLLLLYFKERIPEKFRKITNFCVRALSVCMILELFVFNFNSTHLIAGNYPEQVLDMSAANVSNFDRAEMKNISEGYFSVEFPDLNVPVGTVTFDAESADKDYVNITIDMSDETFSAYYRSGVATAKVIYGNERSQTAPCRFSGTVSGIKFAAYADTSEVIHLRSITINKPFMLEFSLIRFLLFFLGSIAVYLLATAEFFRRSYCDNRRGVKIVVWTFVGIFIASTLWLANISRFEDPEHSLYKDFHAETGNQITQSIVDAFENGSVKLDFEMNEILAGLDNPYDTSQRDAGQIGYYHWDHLYYDGAYYSYYGIGPVLTLFLPYHMITGYYFPSVWAVWLFGALGILFLTKFYFSFIDKFYSKTRSSLVVLGIFIIQLSSGVLFCYNTPKFYEIAQLSGFVSVTAGAFFLMSSNVIGDGKIKNWRLCLATVFLSLAVLCRPTLAVYCVAALIFIYAGFRKKKNSPLEDGKKKNYIAYFLSAMMPFVLIGGIQVVYNYARFGNPFDFGIQYSLTINDFTHTEFQTHMSAIGFFDYLFVIPKFIENFPFLTGNDVFTFQPQGYYFVATFSALGLLWKALPILSFGKSLKAYRLNQNKNKNLYTILIIAVCILCPFIIMASIWESGYGARYCVDFAWQIIIGALAVAFIVYENSSENMKNHLNKLMIASAVICFVLNFGQTYSWIGVDQYVPLGMQADALSLARIFEFWN